MAGADVGAEVERLLVELSARAGAPAAELGERLVSVLVDYYGAGLSRIAALLDPEALHRLAADPLVESQLILHGLHPLGVDDRIELALDRVRPYLGSHAGGISYLGVDEDGVARLRLSGNCSGCPSSPVTVRTTIEEAVLAAAPEVASVDVAGQTEQPALLQIGHRLDRPPVRWVHPSAPDLPTEGRTTGVRLEGIAVLMARLDRQLYAYADECPRCGTALTAGTVAGTTLSCSGCAGRYDLHLAGRSVDGGAERLRPLPLLDDVAGIRVALEPEAV